MVFSKSNAIKMISQLYNKRVVFIDLETTGIPKIGAQVEGVKMPGGYGDYTNNSCYDGSRIVQIGWAYYDKFSENFEPDEDDVNVVTRKPYNFTITDESFKIHGISQEKALEEGVLIKKILKGDLGEHLKKCDYIVAYNAYFDFSILMNELHRAKNEDLYKKLYAMRNDNVVCLKQIGLLYTKKIHTQGKLYKVLYGEDAENQHDAKSDVFTMLKILQYIIQNPNKEDDNLNINAGNYWSKKEDKTLQEHYLDDEKSVSEIAQLHGRTEGAIVSRLKKLGLMIEDGASKDSNENSFTDSYSNSNSRSNADSNASTKDTQKEKRDVVIKHDRGDNRDYIILKKRVDDLEKELTIMKEMYRVVMNSLELS
ncbi:UvrD/REP helicase family protein [Yasminevirus sp. GU-2018]|uniref:UvrD/REP helicase family protein n=1 Tax=Yasminevirus sp. GU-2018 TaxID=2420051 RepID=A0A5K0U8S4_9VIRU|nr:UvrD/REP helicase family protein [Yasminevirus sp. GU-2018]